MRLGSASWILAGVCLLTLAGCGCGGGNSGDGVKSEVADEMSKAVDAAKRADGKYEKLTPEEKQIFLKLTDNNEAQAKERVKMMAHPPNEKYLKKS